MHVYLDHRIRAWPTAMVVSTINFHLEGHPVPGQKEKAEKEEAEKKEGEVFR